MSVPAVMVVARRRTQAERRETTIGRLVDVTIAQLAERGYSQLTVATVCERAALSQGALFRHFANRNELIAAATREVCRRHLALVTARLGGVGRAASPRALRSLVTGLRAAARSPEHAAWHEVMVAARTDAELHALVVPALQAFEHALLTEIRKLTDPARAARLGTVLVSVLHLLDSEAVTVAVYPSPRLEADRVAWLVELLSRELGS